MDRPDKNCIIFFVKYPEKGRVKTRLSAELNDTIAIELYRNFILDLLTMLEKLGTPFQICFSPVNSQERFMKWLGDDYSYVPQQGEDLGQRMKNALIQAFDQGFRRAVIIGSDSPDLHGNLIHEAFSFLRTHDAVIGPSLDGGYYLIGFNSGLFFPKAFDGIKWSTDTVFRDTISILEKARFRIHKLPEWRDVDTFADLQNLYLRNQDGKFFSSRTMFYVHNELRMLDYGFPALKTDY
jgi:rSAM/selenodomain-associated transferase 1